jgi:2-isopropylmalate synthase
MDPRDIGIPSSRLVLGKHSGRHAFKERIEHLGYTLAPEQVDRFFDRFKQLADKKKQVYDADIEALVNAELADRVDLWSLDKLQTVAGSNAIPTATVTLRREGQSVTDAATGDGPVDAVYEAIQRITGVRLQLTDYQLRAITTGADAQGEVTIEVERDGARFRTHGVSTDIVEASALAYLAAVNRSVSASARQRAQDKPAHP